MLTTGSHKYSELYPHMTYFYLGWRRSRLVCAENNSDPQGTHPHHYLLGVERRNVVSSAQMILVVTSSVMVIITIC